MFSCKIHKNTIDGEITETKKNAGTIKISLLKQARFVVL